MKKYIKPSMDVVAVEGLSQMMSVSEVYNQPGDPNVGQLSKGRFEEESDDEGW